MSELINSTELLAVVSGVAILCSSLSLGAAVLMLRRLVLVEAAMDRMLLGDRAAAAVRGFGGTGPLRR
jgi:hypothetical protein